MVLGNDCELKGGMVVYPLLWVCAKVCLSTTAARPGEEDFGILSGLGKDCVNSHGMKVIYVTTRPYE